MLAFTNMKVKCIMLVSIKIKNKRIMTFIKNNQNGFAHWIIPALMVVIVGAIGVKTLSESSAATNSSDQTVITSPAPDTPKSQKSDKADKPASQTVTILKPGKNATVKGFTQLQAETTLKAAKVAFYANGRLIPEAAAASSCSTGSNTTTAVNNTTVCWDTSKLSAYGSTQLSAIAYDGGAQPIGSATISVNVSAP